MLTQPKSPEEVLAEYLSPYHRPATSSPTASRAELDRIEESGTGWANLLFPSHTSFGFSNYQTEFWDHIWSIEKDGPVRPFVAIWSRGGGKSSSVELATAALGTRGVRRYILYVAANQVRADDHVQNVASLLESSQVAYFYPASAERAVGKFGSAKGWRRNRLRTASGFTVDAIGLDTAARGAKIDEYRPDVIILDDIDSETDDERATQKKVNTLTTKILPAGSPHTAVIAVQNLIIENGVFARLSTIPFTLQDDFLTDRIISGPHKALEDFEFAPEINPETGRKHYVISGTPTWDGLDLDRCQALCDKIGLTAFQKECQHDVKPQAGGMFSHLDYQRVNWLEMPDLVRVTVWIDPAVTDTDQSDAHGIQADGIDASGRIYRLFSWEHRASPEQSIEVGLLKAIELKADSVGIETDQGGDTWKVVYDKTFDRLRKSGAIHHSVGKPKFKSAKASGHGPKVHRASKMLADYEKGNIFHVRSASMGTLEKSLWRYPLTKPLDLVDAGFWSWNDLRKYSAGAVRIGGIVVPSIWPS